MCVSAGLAQFTGTILYLGRRNHPEHGQVFVLGYENRATNLSEGPNAMLLHFPGYPVALCCFDNTEARESEPLLLWYKPMNPDRFVLPGLD